MERQGQRLPGPERWSGAAEIGSRAEARLFNRVRGILLARGFTTDQVEEWLWRRPEPRLNEQPPALALLEGRGQAVITISQAARPD